jgi:mono/diheme cytochrome c family protein
MNQEVLAACTLIVALGFGFQSPGKPHAQAMTPQRAGEIFAEKCASCHVAADPAFATDRAWIGQLRETA